MLIRKITNEADNYKIFANSVSFFDYNYAVAAVYAVVESGWDFGDYSDILLFVYKTRAVFYGICYFILFFNRL
jgi:hypothetical protein